MGSPAEAVLLLIQGAISPLWSTLLVLAFWPRLLVLTARDVKVSPLRRHWRPHATTGLFVFLAVLQLVLVVQWSLSTTDHALISVLSSAIRLCAILGLTWLTRVEYYRSVRPSWLAETFLSIATCLDAVQIYVVRQTTENQAISVSLGVSILVKVTILSIESRGKLGYLSPQFEDEGPEALAGALNRSFLFWLNSLLLKGRRSKLTVDDFCFLDRRLISSQTTFTDWTSSHSKSNRHSHSLLFFVIEIFKWRFLAVAAPRILVSVCKFMQPWIIHQSLKIMENPASQQKNAERQIVVMVSIVVYIGLALGTVHYKHSLNRNIIQIRGLLIDLIYERTLSLKSSKASDALASTLISTDIDRIMAGLENFDNLWACPLEVLTAIWLLSTRLGLASLSPLLVSVACTSIAVFLGKISAGTQKRWPGAVQERIAITTQILKDLKGVKMLGLVEPVSNILEQCRATEILASKRHRMMNVFMNTTASSSPIVTPVVTFVVYVLFFRSGHDGVLDPSRAFTSLALIALLSGPVQLFTFSLPRFAASTACFARIQEYLWDDDMSEYPRLDSEFYGEDHGKDRHHPDLTREKITDGFEMAEISSRSVTEYTLPQEPERLQLCSKVTFSWNGRDATISGATVALQQGKLTILLGPVGAGKSTFLLGLLGEVQKTDGVVLSVNLQNVAYCPQSPWVPNATIRHAVIGESPYDRAWYDRVITAVVLHMDLASLDKGDQTLVGGEGTNLSGGQKQRVALARALYSRKSLVLLDDVMSGLDQRTQHAVFQNVFGVEGLCRRHSMTVLLATHERGFAAQADEVLLLNTNGEILQQSRPTAIDLDEKLHDLHLFDSSKGGPDNETIRLRPPRRDSTDESPQAKAGSGGELPVFHFYLKAIGLAFIPPFLFLQLTYAFTLKFPDVWVKWWSESEAIRPGQHTSWYMLVYACLAIGAISSLIAMIWMFLVTAVPRASTRLHQTLVQAVLNAPLSFISTQDPGSLLNNRFSQDMSLTDMQLPFAILMSSDGTVQCATEALLIAFGSSWTPLLLPPLVFVLYFLQKFYLNTSRQLRLLTIESRAPLLNNMTETLRGLVTIRAFGWQQSWTEQNKIFLDRSQMTIYGTFAMQRWLNLVLDLIVGACAITVIAVATSLESSSNASLGVALVNVLNSSFTLSYFVQSWTELETAIGAVARVKSFADDTPVEQFPSKQVLELSQAAELGSVTFSDFSASYSSNTENVLSNVNLSIRPRERVGIVGRTGSGKSSMILSILQMTVQRHGSLIIGGITSDCLQPDAIRSIINVIPQDPMFLPGSVRFNLNPYSASLSDSVLIESLFRVGLDIQSSTWDLNAQMPSSSVSQGQKQLFCLARAMLRKCRVVLMDECTASVDMETEKRIVRIVAEEFKDCTVIAVAHRLETLRDFDRIVTMDKGRIVADEDRI